MSIALEHQVRELIRRVAEAEARIARLEADKKTLKLPEKRVN